MLVSKPICRPIKGTGEIIYNVMHGLIDLNESRTKTTATPTYTTENYGIRQMGTILQTNLFCVMYHSCDRVPVRTTRQTSFNLRIWQVLEMNACKFDDLCEFGQNETKTAQVKPQYFTAHIFGLFNGFCFFTVESHCCYP
mgnify:CR=1 FL=1